MSGKSEVEFWKERALIEGEAVMQASEEAERLRAENERLRAVLARIANDMGHTERMYQIWAAEALEDA